MERVEKAVKCEHSEGTQCGGALRCEHSEGSVVEHEGILGHAVEFQSFATFPYLCGVAYGGVPGAAMVPHIKFQAETPSPWAILPQKKGKAHVSPTAPLWCVHSSLL